MQTRNKRYCRQLARAKPLVECIVSYIRNPILVGNLRLVCKEYARLIHPRQVHSRFTDNYIEQAYKCGHCPCYWMGGVPPLDNSDQVKKTLLSWEYDHDNLLDWSDPPIRVNSVDLCIAFKKRVRAMDFVCHCGEPRFHIRVGARARAKCPHDMWCTTCISKLGQSIADEVRETLPELSDDESGDYWHPPIRE